MKIVVTDKWSSLIKDDTLVENSEKLYIVEFLFAESWNGFTKTVIFTAGSVTIESPLTDDRSIVPSQCLEQAGSYLQIGVYGIKGDRRIDTVWCLTSKILRKATLDQIYPGDPTYPETPEEIHTRIIEVIRSNTATDGEVSEELEKVFGSDLEDTATDEEVDELINYVFGQQP